WADEYKPIQIIDPTWYNTITTKITSSKLEIIIKEAPNTKATGPSKISNEMLKHLGPQAKATILNLLNNCLTLYD
ncbi:11446_t:CDS:1, partial [Ambispora leptoticha]